MIICGVLSDIFGISLMQRYTQGEKYIPFFSYGRRKMNGADELYLLRRKEKDIVVLFMYLKMFRYDNCISNLILWPLG